MHSFKLPIHFVFLRSKRLARHFVFTYLYNIFATHSNIVHFKVTQQRLQNYYHIVPYI